MSYVERWPACFQLSGPVLGDAGQYAKQAGLSRAIAAANFEQLTFGKLEREALKKGPPTPLASQMTSFKKHVLLAYSATSPKLVSCSVCAGRGETMYTASA